MALTKNQRITLNIISSNTKYRDMMPRAHAIFNASVPELLRRELIRYHGTRTGYRLTVAGKKALSESQEEK